MARSLFVQIGFILKFSLKVHIGTCAANIHVAQSRLRFYFLQLQRENLLSADRSGDMGIKESQFATSKPEDGLPTSDFGLPTSDF